MSPQPSYKLLRSCDPCRKRKVRCSGQPGPCTRCRERSVACHFGQATAPRRRKGHEFITVSPGIPPKPATEADPPQRDDPARADKIAPVLDNAQLSTSIGLPLPRLYVDQLLAQPRSARGKEDKPFALKGYGLLGGNYSLAYFSDSRLQYLRAHLRADRVSELVRRISSVVRSRLHPADHGAAGSFAEPKRCLEISKDAAAAANWIELYFQHIHPMYPFLDRQWFEATARRTDIVALLGRDKSLCALYHAVLALGCLHEGCGSFEPGKGRAWRLFSTSLALFPDLLTLPDSLTALQAVAAMAVYSSGISCLSVERIILSEGARRAQSLAAASNLTGPELVSFRKTFWVLYGMEKTTSLFMGRNSTFVDLDIACPVPSVPESISGELDWFLTSTRYARLTSRALISLFSAGVAGRPKTYYLAAVDQLSDELERWRLLIPPGLRPGGPSGAPHTRLRSQATPAALWVHLLYHSFLLTLSRTVLQLASSQEGLVSPDRQATSKDLVMNAAQSMLELTTLIDVEPYTPLWVIAGVPIMALFVLFDQVLQNPAHLETGKNLALIDIGGGYFSRLEYASGGSLPGSLITEFAHLAREYVNDVRRQPQPQARPEDPAMPQTDMSPLGTSQRRTSAPGSADFGQLAQMFNMSTAAAEGQAAASEGALDLPSDALYDLGSDLLAGTDLMGLFSSNIPGIDPVFWPGPAEMSSLLGSSSNLS